MSKKDREKSTNSTVENSKDSVSDAKDFAYRAHSGQKYGHRPFTTHLQDTVLVLKEFGYGFDDDLMKSAWLHDVVEDTDILIDQVYSRFGDRVGDLVDAVTDGPGKSREEKKERPYKMIPEIPGAVILKLADRIANVRHSMRSRKGKNRWIKRYRVEYAQFRRCLRRSEGAEMWDYLDSLLEHGEE